MSVFVYAFDPVDELGGTIGVLFVSAEFAGRLVAECRAELIEEHKLETERYVTGSAAHGAAREALRTKRGEIGVRKVRASRLERAP